MTLEAHFFASWLIAAKTTNNPRDCRLVTLAGILPDADGLGLLVDVVNHALGRKETFFYADYHHWWLHGLFGGVLITALLVCFARQRWRVALLALILFHLHLLCDLAGSRGPSPGDLWAIFYYGPFSRHPMWIWSGQWRLDGWANRFIATGLFLWALWLATKRSDSFVGVFNRRLDKIFVGVLHKWRTAWLERKAKAAGILK